MCVVQRLQPHINLLVEAQDIETPTCLFGCVNKTLWKVEGCLL